MHHLAQKRPVTRLPPPFLRGTVVKAVLLEQILLKILAASLKNPKGKFRKEFASEGIVSLKAMLDSDRLASSLSDAIIRVYDDVSVRVTYLYR